MLESTFIHSPGIGPTIERRLWSAGVLSWEDALQADLSSLVGPAKGGVLRDTVFASQQALIRKDHQFFASAIPKIHHWRAARKFSTKTAYLDIETSLWNQVTVVGVYDGCRTHTFVQGDNLAELPELLASYALLVTYNGGSFDLPMLKKHCGINFDQLHIDLCPLLRRLGYKGGLKKVEKDFGIAREELIDGLSGNDAVLLWEAHRRGDRKALQMLVAYNTADVVNLEILLEAALEKCASQFGPGFSPEA